MLSFEEALSHLLGAANTVCETEELPLEAALGYILAADQYSSVRVPPLDNSSMDGYAVQVGDVSAQKPLVVSQRIAAGQIGGTLEAGTAARIFTGAPVPQGANAVIMQESCEVISSDEDQNAPDQVLIQEQPTAGQNIRQAGEDIESGACILEKGCRLTPQELGLAATGGLPKLPVFRRLRVAVFFTGDELKTPGEPLPPGAIYNSNRTLLTALLQGMGCEISDFGIVPDNLEATRATLRKAAKNNDLVITSGGVSVGEEDHVRPAVAAEGRIDLWKIAIKPGKPLAFGELSSSDQLNPTRFIGLPGNPVSSYVTFVLLVRPLIQKMQGMQIDAQSVSNPPFLLPAGFCAPADSRLEFLRVRVGADKKLEVFQNQSSGVVTSLVWAHGLAVKPKDTAVEVGDMLGYWPLDTLV